MKIEFEIKETLGLKDYLIKYYSFSFFGYVRQVKGTIICDGKSIRLNDKVNKGSHVEINYTSIKQVGNPSDKPIKVVYEDKDCIVINKDAGVTCCPSRLHQEDTLFNRLQYYFKDQEVTLHFINRLDKDTSGLVLVCKNQFAACLFSKYQDQFIKEYQAETYNKMPRDEDIIELPIKRESGMKRWVNKDGKPAKTHYKLISEDEGVYKYLVRIYTGLTHQIRVHFAYFNCPLINDPIYSSDKKGRMHLHSCYLKFYHPIKEQWIELNSIPNFYK